MYAEIVGQALPGFKEITFADDVIAVEDAPGEMSKQTHGDAFRHAGTNEIARRGPSTIVQVLSGQAGCRTD